MNHPKLEELTDYLYEELPPERQTEIATHVKNCAECRALADSWRATRSELRSWKLTPRRTRVAAAGWRSLRLPTAAAAMLAIGFGLARWTSTATDPVALRAELTRELTGEIKQALSTQFTQFATDQLAQQKVYQEAVTTVIRQMETQRVVDLVSLRRAVETVAVNAEDRFESTQQDLAQIASADAPEVKPIEPQN